MRRFVLVREHDVSGVSGTGIVAEGVEFGNLEVALHWLGEYPTTTYHRNITSVKYIHGHGGSTKVVWLDTFEDHAVRLAAATGRVVPSWVVSSVPRPTDAAGNTSSATSQVYTQLPLDLDGCP